MRTRSAAAVVLALAAARALAVPGDVTPRAAPDGRVSASDVVLAASLALAPQAGSPDERAAVDVAPGWVSDASARPARWTGRSDAAVDAEDLRVLRDVVLECLTVERASATPFADRFAALDDVRAAVRSSPDSLPAAAARAVATRDPARILAFVRDAIAPVPAAADGFGDPVTGTRFGTRSALRSGIATLREKADLLAQLYREAGFPATVVSGPVLGGAAAARAEVLRPLPLPFAPELAPARLEAWRAALGGAVVVTPVHADADAAESSALGGAILDAIDPFDFEAPPFNWESLTAWPLVEVVVDGVPTHANPHVAAARLGESWTAEPPQPARAAAAPPQVEITAWGATTASPPNQQLQLVKGRWSLADIAGRQVVLTFAPTAPLREAIVTPVGDLRTFIPSLVVQGSDVDAETIADLMVAGDVITTAGERMDVASDGTFTIDGRVVESTPATPETIAAVDAMTGEVAPGTFPEVEVRLEAADAAGLPVEGLTASAFTLEEDGVARPFTLISSVPPAPRVLFLFDVSDSIPAEFRGAAAAAMARSIAETLASAVPGCEFRAAAVGSFGASPHGTWTSDPVVLETNALAVNGFGSALWTALASSGSLGATAIVFITDGQATDTATTQRLGQIAAGPPCIIVATGTPDVAQLDAMASAARGAWFPATDSALAAAEAEERVLALTRQFYVLRYTSASDGPPSRSVRVGLEGSDTGVTLAFDVPAMPQPPRRWVTLGLTVKVGSLSVTRVIAGEAIPGTSGWVPSDAVLDDVQLALLSAHVLSFEGGAPTTAALVDDALAGLLAQRPLYDTADGPVADRLAVLDAGWFSPPMQALVAQPPLPGHREGGVLTFETSPRVTLQAQVPASGRAVRRLDVLPLTRFATALEDPLEAARTTLRRTARLALAEAGTFPTNTLALIGSEPLTDIPPGLLPPFTGATQAEWRERTRLYAGNINVVPADGAPGAFWTVDPRSGTVLGILPDGTGGAREDAAAILDLIKRLYALMASIGDRLALSPGFGGFLVVQQLQYAILLECTVAVSTLGTGQEPDLTGVDTALDDFWCDAAKEGLYASNLLGLVGAGLEALDDILQVLTGNGLPCRAGG